tara:strand:- start:11873 stop:12070 length:198 start_codon:yes stop_codon:yes gene_type:complete
MNAETYVENVVIDICNRSFLVTSDNNDERMVECDSVREFMDVLEVCTAHLEEDQILYTEPVTLER